MKTHPYFCATCEIALATPECKAPTRNATSLRVIMRSATREPVAGVVSVSMWIASMRLPSTPPLSLNSLIAIIAPSRSSPPLAAYWPEASIVRPSTSGFGVAACAQTRLWAQGPKNDEAPATARPEAFSKVRRAGSTAAMAAGMAGVIGSVMFVSGGVEDSAGCCPLWKKSDRANAARSARC